SIRILILEMARLLTSSAEGGSRRRGVLLHQFKTNAGRIGVANLDVVDGQGNTGGVTILGGDSLAQVGGEGGNMQSPSAKVP
ncbi:MAG: hypothetical protein ACYTGS_19120, partial [Planctomycetota bacterium]